MSYYNGIFNGQIEILLEEDKGDVMPKGYEKMRDKFQKEGMNKKAAQEKAAKIWNSKHPKNPVTGKHKGK